MDFELTVELLQDLDIKVARLTGLLKEPQYYNLLSAYELDTMQCVLWMEVSQVLAYILDANEYEDIVFYEDQLGLEVKKMLAAKPDKFEYIKQLLIQYDILHLNAQVGRIIKESVEDIEIIYTSIHRELKSIMASQDDIRKMVEGQNNK